MNDTLKQSLSVLKDFAIQTYGTNRVSFTNPEAIRFCYKNGTPDIKRLSLKCWQEYDPMLLVQGFSVEYLSNQEHFKMLLLCCDLFLTPKSFEKLNIIDLDSLKFINEVKNSILSGKKIDFLYDYVISNLTNNSFVSSFIYYYIRGVYNYHNNGPEELSLKSFLLIHSIRPAYNYPFFLFKRSTSEGIFNVAGPRKLPAHIIYALKEEKHEIFLKHFPIPE